MAILAYEPKSDSRRSHYRPTAIALTLSWILTILVIQILRGVPTPPGRPDDLDYYAFAALPLATSLVAWYSRSIVPIWLMVAISLLGAWCAWQDNTRLYLDIAFNGIGRHIQWWIRVIAWITIGGRLGPAG